MHCFHAMLQAHLIMMLECKEREHEMDDMMALHYSNVVMALR